MFLLITSSMVVMIRVWDTANLYVGGAVQGGAITETVEANQSS